MELSIPALLYEEDSVGVFLLVTMAIGGGAAWLSGRAIAATWRPWWYIVAYMLILGAAVRFFHYALFGFRVTRARQMATQYGFLITRTGLLSWARRGGATKTDAAKSG